MSMQIAVSVNCGPAGGRVAVSPASGTALVTNFTMSTAGWADPEGDLPLAYR
jgi:hypothetical protein